MNRVILRVLLSIFWLLAMSALVGALMLPKALDIYIKERYVVVHRASVVLTVITLLLIPLMVLTVWHLRSRHV